MTRKQGENMTSKKKGMLRISAGILVLFIITQGFSIGGCTDEGMIECSSAAVDDPRETFVHILGAMGGIRYIPIQIDPVYTFAISVYAVVYRLLNTIIDLIIENEDLIIETGNMLLKIWGVTSASIGIAVVFINIIATLFALIPALGAIPKILVMVFINLPLAIVATIFAFFSLSLALLPYLSMSLDWFRDQLPEPQEL